MDLIDRQAAIGILCRALHYNYEEGYAVTQMLALPSAQPEPKWIAVEERLPIREFEEGRENRTVYDLYPCLVTRYSTHTEEPQTRTYVCKSYFDGEDFMLHGGYAPNEGSDTENTLAWMPLPEPCRKEAEDETSD